MVTRTAEFDTVSNRLIVFSGITFALKVLPVTAISFSDVNLEVKDKNVAVGLIATLLLFLLVSSISILIRDALRDRINDLRAFRNARTELGDQNFKPYVESLSEKIEPYASSFSDILNIMIPIIFSIVLILMCVSDISSFLLVLPKVIFPS